MKFAGALVLSWLSAHGYAERQRDAVYAVARQENPLLQPAAESGHGDLGLFQWRGARRRALAAWERRRVPQLAAQSAARFRPAERHAGARLVAQLEFMDREWRAMPASREFFRAPTALAAALIFCRHFERRRSCRGAADRGER